jgi:uncharacterized protein (TIGR02265 family)
VESADLVDRPALSEGFSYPSFEHELDERAEIDGIPRDATVKGLYFQSLIGHGREHGFESQQRHVGLMDYSNREYTELIFEIAPVVHPGVPQREAVRLLGRHAFPALKQSLWGRAVFGALSGDLVRLFGLVSKGWEMSQSHVQARLVASDAGRAHIELARCSLLDTYVVGIFEGIILAAGQQPFIGLRKRGPRDGELECLWR